MPSADAYTERASAMEVSKNVWYNQQTIGKFRPGLV
jgi:hypothetical protein